MAGKTPPGLGKTYTPNDLVADIPHLLVLVAEEDDGARGLHVEGRGAVADGEVDEGAHALLGHARGQLVGQGVDGLAVQDGVLEGDGAGCEGGGHGGGGGVGLVLGDWVFGDGLRGGGFVGGRRYFGEELVH